MVIETKQTRTHTHILVLARTTTTNKQTDREIQDTRYNLHFVERTN